MFVADKNVLKSTVQKYIGQATRLLLFFGFRPETLHRWREIILTYGRPKITKPKKEICALRWTVAQRICSESRALSNPYVDSVLGRAVLTIAYTTGARVGCLLPPRDPKRAEKHIPILRTHVRKIGRLFHIFQPQSKVDREGRGRLLIVNPTNCPGCPVRALQELLLCTTDDVGRLFTTGGIKPTSDWFREWFR